MALLPLQEAIARILDNVRATESEDLPLHACGGRVLAKDVVALRTQPPFDVSAMDGYAIRAQDAKTAGSHLKLVGSVAAGTGYPGVIGVGEAVRIFTGAPVPSGADTILIQENAEASGGGIVTAMTPAAAGRHIRRAGIDFRDGDVALRAGRMLDPAALSLAAACNHAVLPVHKRPRVALISTGDELCLPGTQPGPHQIIASNAFGVAAIARDAGAEVIDLGIVKDNLTKLSDAVDEGLARADILVTLGGASVGDHDLVQKALLQNQVAVNFWKIAVRPGKPTLYGRKSDTHVLGLPGNPVASLICAQLFIRPLVAALTGYSVAQRVCRAVLGADMQQNDHREDYVRAKLSEQRGETVVTPFLVQDSSMLSVMADADCLIIRPALAPAASRGEVCNIIRLRDR